MKLSEEDIGENLHELGLSKVFLDMTLRAKAAKDG